MLPLPPDVVAALLEGHRDRARDMLARVGDMSVEEADKWLAGHEQGSVGKVFLDPALGRLLKEGDFKQAVQALCDASGMDRDEAKGIVDGLRSRNPIVSMTALARLGNSRQSR